MDITAAGLPVPNIGPRTGQHALANGPAGEHALARRQPTQPVETELQGEVLAEERARQEQHARSGQGTYEGQVVRLKDNPAVNAYLETESFSTPGVVNGRLDLYV